MKIIVDIDSTLNNLVGYFCEKINQKRGTSLTPETLNTYDMTPWLEPGGWAHFLYEGLFIGMEPIKDSKKVLKKYYKDNEIIIVSDTGPMFQAEKTKWLKKHFPFIKEIIYTSEKDKVGGDIIIDDNPRHLISFSGHKITLEYGYNKNINGVKYAKNWKEIDQILEELTCTQSSF